MATILIDALAGSGNLEAHTPNTGSASYVLESGGSLVIASTAARSATTDTESKYRYDVASGTAACRVVMDFYLDNADGASYGTMYVNRQADGETYEFVVQGNGNCTLYHMSAGGSATTIQSFGSVGFSGYWRFDVAHDGSGGFVVSAWRSVDRADLGSAPYLVVNAATATDGGANITTAGKTGLRVRNAAFLGVPSPGFTDSASGGGATASGIATETDTALALAGKQIRALGMATETDTALALVTLAGLPFNTAPYEFGQRTGLDVDDFSIYASTALNVSVYAATDVLLASQLFAYTESTGSDGRLTRKTHASLTAGSTYIFVAVTTGGAMVAAGRITAT